MAHLFGVDAERLAIDPTHAGPLLESFVAIELRKQIGWSQASPTLFHFRTSTGYEVDLVLEIGTRLVGIEVKAGATVNEHDFRGLRLLAEAAASSAPSSR